MVICNYCSKGAHLIMGKALYPHNPKLWQRKYWQCLPCKAWIECRSGSEEPLGRLADAFLRGMKHEAWTYFTRLIDRKIKGGAEFEAAMFSGKQWLAKTTGIPLDRCISHQWTLEECRKVIALCRPYCEERKWG